MRRSKAEIYFHCVWATKDRQALVTPSVREQLYPFLKMQAAYLRCETLALGGLSDHLHLVVRTPTTVCPADLMKLVKGTSSAFINDLTQRSPYFRWQEGYGCFSLARPLLPKVIAYTENQEGCHIRGRIWGEWEEIDEEVPEGRPPSGEEAKKAE